MNIKIYKGNVKGLFFVLFFRLSSFFTKNLFLRIIGIPIRLLYMLIINWIIGIDISDKTKIGKNFVLWHGIGLIVHPDTIIGDNVVLRHNTTIGSAKNGGIPPKICDGVNVGANCVIIGDITIGNNAVIGAGSVVLKDVHANVVVAGNPAVIIKYLN